ncbi:hypothetical protein C7S18_08720 [Ahniella affigens]|uniref:TonB-dependent receptor n=1 Tax=Ahniella affigens TaxID=2021234 RepID=A0A2P1PR19_9GAMM|nr:carboxypeptidase-like regulatory domain-containing protein [Ahniella affigens]AVP97271.1 hypothetical protein C7S18_08720 [Ahniella affigens]
MTTRVLSTIVFALAFLVLAVFQPAHAQLQSGNLFVYVTDESAQALPGVTVTVTGEGAPQVQVTNAAGQARFLGLAPGTYSLKAELEGYSTLNYPSIDIEVGRNTSIEVTMSPAIEDVITIEDPSEATPDPTR